MEQTGSTTLEVVPELDHEPDPTDVIVAFENYSGGFRGRHGGRVTPILKGVDVAFRRGALTAVVGETGSGKTMLALSIVGLTPATFERTGGSIHLNGTDLGGYDEAAFRGVRGRTVAMVFQDSRSALNPVFTVGRQLVDVVRLHQGLGKAAARTRAVELLEQMRVPEPERRLRQYPHELSGGTAQRVQLAIALACEPELLLLDEPTTGLDLTVQAEVLELIVEMIKGGRLSALLITHDMGVVAQTCDDVVVLRHGEICESGRTSSVLTNPTHPYTAELVAASQTLGGTR
ncbi:ABC transporter ATP-binding protein [Microlunatus antarcticus]|uniref:ABC-type glutathione transport system ATPase component n=1 Tax=Microlunatus antarcticus TaxID=53388 RepID=A0A7W5JXL7_9ACTN|nr:ABC transporter ATP-binding protein [Microlunatus antarcticus]MBB3328209.1 ABC-type glutathione transport system ATPase component [Microlunatus antarcticus]